MIPLTQQLVANALAAEHSHNHEYQPPLCIYHGNCADGFGAAWVVNKAFDGQVELFAGTYNKTPPQTTGRDVIFVDFSYKLPVMEEILKYCNSLTVIDHHKSAMLDLQPLVGSVKTEIKFDMNHSGAMLAWLIFFPHLPPPALLNHIEDRDLWRFHLEGTEDIQANIFSFPYDLTVWNDLMSLDARALQSTFRAEGASITRKHLKDINELLPLTTRFMNIDGNVVPIANMSYMMASDAGHKLAHLPAFKHKFAGSYYDTQDRRVFSLRSSEQGMDVSEVAVKYTGGGHMRAAGFSVTHEVAKTLELPAIYASQVKEIFES